MRYLRKRLTCVNRGNTSDNQKAMIPILKRYEDRMKKTGWKIDSNLYSRASGNAFFQWEMYVSFYKLSNKDKREKNKNVAFFKKL